MNIEIISGSARNGSVTRRVALHLLSQLSTTIEVKVGLIDIAELNIPPVNSVIHRVSDAPEHLRTIASRMIEANGIILVSPEYNGGYSPAMKNFLDHFPQQFKRTYGIVTASPGALGGLRAALQMQPLIYGLGGIGSPQMLVVPDVEHKFDASGCLTDLRFKPSVQAFLEKFLWLTSAISLKRMSAVVNSQ